MDERMNLDKKQIWSCLDGKKSWSWYINTDGMIKELFGRK